MRVLVELLDRDADETTLAHLIQSLGVDDMILAAGPQQLREFVRLFESVILKNAKRSSPIGGWWRRCHFDAVRPHRQR